MLAQSADTTFLLTNREFQSLIEELYAIEILRTEQVEQKRGYLREIAKYVFYFGMEAVVLGACWHESFVADTRMYGK